MKRLWVLTMVCWCLSWGETIRWNQGTWDAGGAPRGKLLSDNVGYWGPAVLTGVTYSYDTPPDNPRDVFRGNQNIFGRRLLDGAYGGDWYVPVGKNYQPLAVTFDFKRPCDFSEVTLYAMRAPTNWVEIHVTETLEPASWRTVFNHGKKSAGQRAFQRLRLPAGSRGRYLKLLFKGEGISWLDEVLVWGEGTVSSEYPEDIRPLAVKPLADHQFQSLRGVRETVFGQEAFQAWRSQLGPLAELPVVWAKGQGLTPRQPILPQKDTINPSLKLVMTRDETESVFVTVTNPTRQTVTCSLVVKGGHASMKAELLAGGILPVNRPKRALTLEETMRLYITDGLPPDAEPDQAYQVLPYFSRRNLLGSNLLRRYVANGESLENFPRRLVLKPGETAPLLIRFTAKASQPGSHEWVVSAQADGRNSSDLRVRTEVLNVTLPLPDAWIRIWGHPTHQFPFETSSRLQEEVAAVRALGMTVWDGFPDPGSPAEMFARTGKTYFHVMGLPGRLIDQGYSGRLKVSDITDQDRQELRRRIEGLCQDARRLGIPYDRWFVELWDEPGESNAALYGEFARIIKFVNPQVRVYMNPLFWRPGFPPQQLIVDTLKPFYNEVIDISCPIQDLLGNNQTTRELWSKPRQVRAFYIHPARRAGRNMAWKAALHGCNGFGYYCYYAPGGNPWSIATWKSLGFAYQMAFPSCQGPVITPIYEEMREAWEDYRLLELLKEPRFGNLRQRILKAYDQPGKKDFDSLRLTILREIH